MKLWDVRKTSEPVKIWKNKNLVCAQAVVNMAISPNERVVITGNSCPKEQTVKLTGYDTVTGEQVCDLDVFEAGEGIS